MATKKYSFITEKVYRVRHEVEVDIDELRKQDKYKDLTDEDILIEVGKTMAYIDTDLQWDLEECNVRSIYDDETNETIYQD